jgi:hypothetical protein
MVRRTVRYHLAGSAMNKIFDSLNPCHTLARHPHFAAVAKVIRDEMDEAKRARLMNILFPEKESKQ